MSLSEFGLDLEKQVIIPYGKNSFKVVDKNTPLMKGEKALSTKEANALMEAMEETEASAPKSDPKAVYRRAFEMLSSDVEVHEKGISFPAMTKALLKHKKLKTSEAMYEAALKSLV